MECFHFLVHSSTNAHTAAPVGCVTKNSKARSTGTQAGLLLHVERKYSHSESSTGVDAVSTTEQRARRTSLGPREREKKYFEGEGQLLAVMFHVYFVLL